MQTYKVANFLAVALSSSDKCFCREFCEMFKADIFALVDREDFYALLNRGKKAHNEKTKTFCTWALKEIKKIKPGATIRNPAATR